ncbi:MAG: dTDP-4-dehydrorhamnose reductase [Sulfuricurvum sp. PD_MW2]|uniref:dTDP-4-dehydrorhamnose reductase n=1 Tax=Sulfuricurvum sp. PD_MW2 TaxID=2027917 RepID=UPI000C061E9B|nr:dTDP-4-dehydrorhamnose reductase [Sulfuricurvum sp. PD_MW2]PHM17941.1 MAG: dTDP-4-dehydrorhamnose reductase [Sulfuricurvum sp. PD_MW2]
MNNILVTGTNGQLGHEIQNLSLKYPHYSFTFTDRTALDLSDLRATEDFFKGKRFDAIINCAAYTAVDKAESEDELADTINHRFVSMLAKIAKRDDSKLIHISTDYVFNGQSHRPYIENDPTEPQGIYGKTKCAGEKAILEISPKNTIILRTSWVYSAYGNNFVKTMLRLGRERNSLGVIFDQVGTPTYARDLASVILEIIPKIDNQAPELYHYSNEGVASWYDFAKAIFELSGITCEVNPINTDQYPTPASRPHYSVLNKSKIKNDFNLTIAYWRDSLQSCLKALGENE